MTLTFLKKIVSIFCNRMFLILDSLMFFMIRSRLLKRGCVLTISHVAYLPLAGDGNSDHLVKEPELSTKSYCFSLSTTKHSLGRHSKAIQISPFV